MRSLVLAIALSLNALTAVAAFAQEPASGSQLWGTEDNGEDKGRVQAKGRSYNVTHIAYAAIMISITGVLLIWFLRRQSGDRDGPKDPPGRA